MALIARRRCIAVLPEDLQFFDKEISGTYADRDGLGLMMEAARARRFDVLYVESLSRFARNLPMSINLLYELAHLRRVRVVSIDEGVDTANPEWEIVASILSHQHAKYIRDLAKCVSRGQTGIALGGGSVGDYCFGYQSVAVGDSTGVARGHERVQRHYAIHPGTAKYVPMVFDWFVVQRWSISRIARELTALGVPKDHRSSTPRWHHDQVRKLLSNKKYIGIWRWGLNRNVRDPITGRLTREPRSESDAGVITREFPELRLIEDEVFHAAQTRLRENHEKFAACRQTKGRLSGSADGNRPNHPLWQLIKCEKCGGCLRTTGANGQYLGCKDHARARCSVKTFLPRDRAAQAIFGEISQRLLSDPACIEVVFEATRREYKRALDQQNAAPQIEESIAAVDQRIRRLLDSLEEGDEPPTDIKERLEQRRREKAELEAKLASCRGSVSMKEPTRDWVIQQIQDLSKLLCQGGDQVSAAVRRLIPEGVQAEEVLIGGKARGYFRLRFRLDLSAITGGARCAPPAPSGPTYSEEIAIEVKTTGSRVEYEDRVKRLWDDGMLLQEIAVQLGIHRNMASKALKHWHSRRGLPTPNVHAHRVEQRLRSRPPLHIRLAEEVWALHEQGMLLAKIAETLNCDRNVVTKAVRHYRDTHDLPKEDGRQRRKRLPMKTRPTALGDRVDKRSDVQ